MPTTEDLIVYLIVACCAAYAFRRLMPETAKRFLAKAFCRGKFPDERAIVQGTTCRSGCDGCGSNVPDVQAVRWLKTEEQAHLANTKAEGNSSG